MNDSVAHDFIIKYQEDVFRFCFYLCRNEAQAEDLAQETFIKVLVNIEKIQNQKSYLFKVAKNLFIDRQRKNKYEKIFLSEQLESKTINPVDLEIWQTLFSLESQDQDIILLIDREGLSLSEAAVVLNQAESSLKSRLMRARDNFIIKWNK